MTTQLQNRSLSTFKQFTVRRGAIFALILVGALLAFEVFNYSTTDFALTDLLGANLQFMGMRWATILSIAFCGIDFAGIARLFTPEKGRDEPAEVWYLFGAWLLAAAMNAILTWWGVTVAVHTHSSIGGSVVGTETLYRVVPVFVAVMVWLIRVLIIGTFSMAGERLFSQAEGQPAMLRSILQNNKPVPVMPLHQQPVRAQTSLRQAPRPEPAYHPVSAIANSNARSTYSKSGSPITRS
jgi:hypothetical protein